MNTGTIARKAKTEAKSNIPLRGLQLDFSLPPEDQRIGTDLK